VKNKKIKFILLGVFILSTLGVYHFSFAESQIEVQESEIIVDLSPNNPEPYQDVTISLSSYATDLNKAIITWKVGGSTVLYGIGKTKYSFKTGPPDVPMNIDISIKTVGSMSSIDKTISITPSEIEIMWESVNGYTPPFYKGKSFPLIGGIIKAVAIPNTSTIKSGNGNISYTWKNNDSVLLDSSGYNKNSFVFKNSMFDQQNNITVIASSVDGSYGAESTINIPLYNPKIIFYKKSPSEGVLYNNALNKEMAMQEDEMTLVAEPYFLPIKGNLSNFNFTWQINGKNIQTPLSKKELTVRPTDRGGVATLNLIVENVNELFQKVSNQLKINL
jgi:hypothetical protein